MNIPPPPPRNLRDAARELGRALAAMSDKPAARTVLAGLEAALPEAAAEVRAVLDDPAGAMGAVLADVGARAAGELRDVDGTIARTIGRALGRGLVKAGKRRADK